MASGAAAATGTLLCRLKQIPVRYPLAFGMVFSGLKTSFSDLLVQKVVEQREQIDWRRNSAFAAFGFLYLGGVQYSIYVGLFGRMFPGAAAFAAKPIAQKLTDLRGMAQLFAQVAIDQCLHHPFMYFPAFYCTKELVMQKEPDLRRCLADYRRNMNEDLLALWKIWVPATLVNFAFMPMHARIPFTAGVSLLWTCILSMMRGGDIEHAQDMVGGAVTGATLHMIEEDLLHSTQNYLFTEPVNLEIGKKHIVLTASGRDKPGWVALLSRTIADAGGSVTESRMVRLGDEFIILMHVSVLPQQQRAMLQALRKAESLKQLNVKCTSIARRNTGLHQALSGVRIWCVGADKYVLFLFT
jgi:predicted amino acid-binding ACT domain protein